MAEACNACYAVNIKVGFACKSIEICRSVAKKTDQISVRLDPETMSALREIEERHGLIPTEFTRRLLDGALEFYRKHGWCSFPATVYPEAFTGESSAAGALAAEKPVRFGRRPRRPKPSA
jgi:hypothetical protein